MSTNTTTQQRQFPAWMQFLHWPMAAVVLTMLGVGVAMATSPANYHRLVSNSPPLGILILLLVVIRYVNRWFSDMPAFPATMSPQARTIASASELLLYALLFAKPLVGWAMLSAAGYPIVLFGSLHRFPIHPHNLVVHAVLRETHTILAYLLFLMVRAHLGATLPPTLVMYDGLFSRMAPWRIRRTGLSNPAPEKD